MAPMASSEHGGLIQFVGIAAGLCSVVSFLPQIRKLMRTRDASGVSSKTCLLTATGFVLWTAYGFLIGSLPIVIANGTSLSLVMLILYYRFKMGASP